MKQLISLGLFLLLCISGYTYYDIFIAKKYPSVYENAKRSSSVDIKKLSVWVWQDIDEERIKRLYSHLWTLLKDDPYNFVITRSTWYSGSQLLMEEKYAWTFDLLIKQQIRENKEYDLNN